jgi:hypothetical protein
MMLGKLRSTFDSEVWSTVLVRAADDFEAERRLLTTQNNTVSQRMQAIISNMSYVQSPTLSQAMEQEFHRFEAEQMRLRQKMDGLERRVQRQEALMQLAKQAENVLANWHLMSLKDQRTVAHAFIVRIVVTPTGKHRVADVEIQWRDDSTDTFVLPYRADKWSLWTPDEFETLRQMIERKASQLEIAAAIPDRTWQAIRTKAYEIVPKRSFVVSPKPIWDEETYIQFSERMEQTGGKLPRNTGSRWVEEEDKQLNEMLDRGAAQLELSAALPHRSWEKIRKRVTLMRGKGFIVPESGKMKAQETYADYLDRTDGSAETMAFRVGVSLERQTHLKMPWLLLPAWGRARLPSPLGSG